MEQKQFKFYYFIFKQTHNCELNSIKYAIPKMYIYPFMTFFDIKCNMKQ